MDKSEQLAVVAENHEADAGVSAPAVPTHVADQRVIVMARCPEAGKAKTRLIPALGPDGAANLHSCLVQHTLRTVLTFAEQTWLRD